MPGAAPDRAMSEWRLTAPALLAHVFFGRGGDTSVPVRRLASAWDAVTGRFGLDHAIDGLGVPRRLAHSQHIAADHAGLIAAAESGKHSVWQACAWAGHGVLAVSVMMAPPRQLDCSQQWAGLERRWAQALAAVPDEGVLGEARIFLALLTAGPDDAAPAGMPETAGELVRAAAPPPWAAGWWRHADVLPLDPRGGAAADDGAAPDDVVIWEMGPNWGDGRPYRRLACVAPERAERAADRLLWTAGDGAPSPVTRHLAHAAALRYQVSVYDGGAPARRLRGEIGRLVDDLPAATAGAASAAAAPLLAARAAAVALRRRLIGMRHAAGVLDGNLRDALPEPGRRPRRHRERAAGRRPRSRHLVLAAARR